MEDCRHVKQFDIVLRLRDRLADIYEMRQNGVYWPPERYTSNHILAPHDEYNRTNCAAAMRSIAAINRRHYCSNFLQNSYQLKLQLKYLVNFSFSLTTVL